MVYLTSLVSIIVISWIIVILLLIYGFIRYHRHKRVEDNIYSTNLQQHTVDPFILPTDGSYDIDIDDIILSRKEE